MNVQVIIDAIVRQTTVLVAQVATTSGMRSPLAKVANQVFLDLVRELEQQGLSRKVVADMFGLALRSYQQKVDRLTESASARGVTLWEAVYGFLKQSEVASRAEVLRRFARDDDSSVKSILKDLVENGLVYQRGRGDECSYRIASDSDLERDLELRDSTGLGMLAWVLVYRDGPLDKSELGRRLKLDPERVDGILKNLVGDGRVRIEEGDAESPVYSTRRCLIPLGDEAGWEAALVDHYQAVVSAMVAKLRNGATRALPPDVIGGSTYSFDIWPGHPYERRALDLLSQTRERLSTFWSEVAQYNLDAERPARGLMKVTFYCGQLLTSDSDVENKLAKDPQGADTPSSIDSPLTASETP